MEVSFEVFSIFGLFQKLWVNTFQHHAGVMHQKYSAAWLQVQQSYARKVKLES